MLKLLLVEKRWYVGGAAKSATGRGRMQILDLVNVPIFKKIGILCKSVSIAPDYPCEAFGSS
ncbi:hypothetical protein PQQ72_03560 [Paraburkholderia strydomiana]|uniref:hypothetical protein n=1 Tax=Paraburkholderia strydomiana TaxID=1245417 RepID=UPI0038B71DDE